MKKVSLILLTSTFLVIGCGGSGGSSSGTNADGTVQDQTKIQNVEYTLNGSDIPTCKNASYIASSKAHTSDDIGVYQCIWSCGSYEGASPVTVHLDFIQYGNTGAWEFNSDTV